jgi:UPF0271 protein
MPSLRSIDLNADLGEGCPNDLALLQKVSSASICCGAHAGDEASIVATLRAGGERGVVLGAHPGFPDRDHFGRREREATSDDVERWIREQCEWLRRKARALGLVIRYLKPHGALYNQAQRQEHVARGVLDAAERLDLPVLGLPGSLLERFACDRGLDYVAEGFPDRRYREDGSLLPRGEPGAVLHEPEEIESHVLGLVADGRVRTLCIHGDEPAAVSNADRVRKILGRNRIVVRSFLD